MIKEILTFGDFENEKDLYKESLTSIKVQYF